MPKVQTVTMADRSILRTRHPHLLAAILVAVDVCLGTIVGTVLRSKSDLFGCCHCGGILRGVVKKYVATDNENRVFRGHLAHRG